MMKKLLQRVKQTAQSILENESLTTNLDDSAAQALLDWGTSCTEMIAQSTAGLDDLEAEQAMYPRLRATRRLMRLVNRWIGDRREMDHKAGAMLLDDIINQAANIYGESFISPSEKQCDRFLMLRTEFADDSQQMIQDLRTLFEPANNATTNSQGGSDGQEIHHQET